MAQNKDIYDVAIIGAGPAGMMAGISAAENGAKAILIEKNGTAGKKMLLTGGGRCNLTNAEFDLRKLVVNYGANGPFLFHGFFEFGPKGVIDFFNGLGLKTVVEEKQRTFPKSGQANTVLAVLLKRLAELGVEIRFDCPVAKLENEGKSIRRIVLNSGKEIVAKNYIIATGGKSFPETGSAGDGYVWARDLGHKIEPLAPGLVPVMTSEDWVKDLAGVSLEAAGIKVFCANPLSPEASARQGKMTAQGEILFTHFGLSGPAILNMSAAIGKLMEKGEVSISINLFPKTNRDQLDKMVLDIFKKNLNRVLKNCLVDIMPQGLALAVSRLANIAPEKTANNITKEERAKLIGAMSDIRLTVAGLLDIEAGMVTTGGVDLKEIDDKTMRSKIIDNLFFAGEIINVHGATGGFNLQQCWSTGRLAGAKASLAKAAAEAGHLVGQNASSIKNNFQRMSFPMNKE